MFTASYGLERLLSIMFALMHHKLPLEVIECSGGLSDYANH